MSENQSDNYKISRKRFYLLCAFLVVLIVGLFVWDGTHGPKSQELKAVTAYGNAYELIPNHNSYFYKQKNNTNPDNRVVKPIYICKNAELSTDEFNQCSNEMAFEDIRHKQINLPTDKYWLQVMTVNKCQRFKSNLSQKYIDKYNGDVIPAYVSVKDANKIWFNTDNLDELDGLGKVEKGAMSYLIQDDYTIKEVKNVNLSKLAKNHQLYSTVVIKKDN